MELSQNCSKPSPERQVMDISITTRQLRPMRNYYYHNKWEEDYFVVPYGNTCMCLICGYIFGTNKKFNVQRHYVRYHNKYDMHYPRDSASRSHELAMLKKSCEAVQNKALDDRRASFSLVRNSPVSTTILSYKIAYILVKSMRPFDEIDMAKEIMMATLNELLEDGEEKNLRLSQVANLPLSQHSVTKRMTSIASNISSQLTVDLHKCEHYSLQINETYQLANNTAFIKMFVRIVFHDFRVMEELLAIIPIKDRSSVQEIFFSFKEVLKKQSVPLNKLVSITVGNVSSALGNRETGLIGLCRKDPDFSAVVNFDCLIRQLSLCAVSLDTTHVMAPVRKIAGLLRQRPSVENHLFRSLLEETKIHDSTNLLNSSRILDKFIEVLPGIKKFLTLSELEFEMLIDRSWLEDLCFFADLTRLLGELDFKLRIKNASIWTLVSLVSTFRETVSLWIEFFRSDEVSDKFIQLEKLLEESGTVGDFCGERFACHLETLMDSLCRKFLAFYKIEIISQYLHIPMTSELDTDEIASRIVDLFPGMKKTTLKQEMIAFRNDDKNRWKISSCGNGIEQFWPTVDETVYRNLVSVFKKIMSCFGTTYLCDSVVELIKKKKTKGHSIMTIFLTV